MTSDEGSKAARTFNSASDSYDDPANSFWEWFGTGTHMLRTPEDWWTMVRGSGYRATIDQLSADAYERVRRQNLNFIRESETRSVEANVIYGQAAK